MECVLAVRADKFSMWDLCRLIAEGQGFEMALKERL